MLDRVAVLSDIHGVLPALDAVLAESDVAVADRIVLTGDIAAGPQPVQVLDRLVALGERVVWRERRPRTGKSCTGRFHRHTGSHRAVGGSAVAQ